jgi:hypothetical protein
MFDRAKGACPALGLSEFVRDFVPSPSMLVNALAGGACQILPTTRQILPDTSSSSHLAPFPTSVPFFHKAC